jgi:O-antigen/teichoic acid export membrane protein
MTASASIMFVSLNIDRWIGAQTLSRQVFGTYAFGWMVMLAAQSLQGLLNSGLLPLLAQRCSQGLHASAYRLTTILSLTLVIGGLVMAIPGAMVLRWTVTQTLPQYELAAPLWLPLLLAAAFRLADFWSSLLLVMRREALLLTIQASAALTAVASYIMWTQQTGGLPEPLSLAWLACLTAFLSHAASAIAVLMVQRNDVRA